MFSDWLLQHPGALQLLGWNLGVVAGLLQLTRRRLWSPIVIFTVLIGVGWAALDPANVPGWLNLFVDLHGVTVETQWAAVAALVALRIRRHDEPFRGLSLAPLLLIGWQGGGAMVTAVIIAATGALERHQPRRMMLLLSAGLFALAELIDVASLDLWVWTIENLPIRRDTASFGVDLGEQFARLAGWLALIRWVFRKEKKIAPD